MTDSADNIENAATGGDGPRAAICVIDGNSILHRAYHAIPDTMAAPDGRPTNALFGFVSMFLKMLEEFHPYGVICVFDKGRPQRRMDLLPQYKAQRPPTDPTLKAQFPMIRELVAAMGVPVMELEGWEGDDLLGTLARQGEQAGYDMLLVTGDRDAYQLVTDHVRVVSTKKGLSDVVIYDPAAVAELYDGVTPAQIPDFYGMKGDSSDNIPGVPGVGPKKAAALLNQYGTLDEVLAHAGEIKGKMGENLREHADDARVSRRVATIDCTAPVTFDAAAAAWPQFDPARVRAHFGELGFTQLTRRVLAYASAADDEQATAVVSEALAPRLPDEALEGEEAWERLDTALDEGAWLGVFVDAAQDSGSLFDLEQSVYVALSSGWVVEGAGCGGRSDDASESVAPVSAGSAKGAPVPPEGHAAEQPAEVLRFGGDDATAALLEAYRRGRVASFSVKDDLHLLVPTDSSEPAMLDLSTFDSARAFDVSVAAYLLDSNRSDYGRASIVAAYLPFELPAAPEEPKPAKGKRSKAALAGVADPAQDERTRRRLAIASAASTLALRDALAQMMDADGSLACFDRIEMPLVPALVTLERAGMTVSLPRLAELSAELGGQLDELRERIYAQAGGEPFNVDSPMQLSQVLFDRLGLPTKGLKKTQRGYYSTNAKVLEDLAHDWPIVADILEYRERAKIKSTYLDALPLQAGRWGDGRVHTQYNQTSTATGRLSSSDPNLQNIPIRSELGRMVRAAFVPEDPDASCILGCDYSQIELRLLAHLSQDVGLIAAFTDGEDFHAETAARVFGVPPSEVTPEMRSRAKAVNFGIVYGQQAYGLSTSLGISFVEAQDMIDRYYIQFPGVRAYLDGLVAFAHEHGWVETMYGRKRHIPELYAKVPSIRSFGDRTAMNHPMQGSAADIIKIAMARVARRMEAEGFKARMIVQVHDELDFDCPLDEVEALSALVREEMTGVAQLRVPLVVSCDTGRSWAEAH
ncbi:MAG: DNA polymerase I [Coriobacteriia bacterium]|nr:DNA polymerase I [Coriobacteriia bacterium]